MTIAVTIPMRNLIFLVHIAFFSIIGCGSDDSPPDVQVKPINSNWESKDSELTFDFRSTKIGQESEIGLVMVDSGFCKCSILFAGTELKGQFVISSCLQSVDGTDDSLTCEDLETTGTYQIKENELNLCDNREDECLNLK